MSSGQLGRMDRLADSVTLLRGYGAQLWLFVQDLTQLKLGPPGFFLGESGERFGLDLYLGTAFIPIFAEVADALFDIDRG